MELVNNKGEQITALNNYGRDYADTYINGGCDSVITDMGESATLNDFIAYLRESSDIKKECIDYLEHNFFEDRNNAIEAEDGMEEKLLEAGYKKYSQYYFAISNNS